MYQGLNLKVVALAGLLIGAATTAQAAPVPASDLLLRKIIPQMDFRWSAAPEIALEPKLLADIRRSAQKHLAESHKSVLAEEKDAKAENYRFLPHSYQQKWDITAETPQLMSIYATSYAFTGGAHGNTYFESRIFDRKAQRNIGFGDLFTKPDAVLSTLTPLWCKALDEERAERRRGLKIEGFSECPKLEAQTLMLEGYGDKISHLKVYVPPYEAGPYAEGTYEIYVPLEAVRSWVKPAYQASFQDYGKGE